MNKQQALQALRTYLAKQPHNKLVTELVDFDYLLHREGLSLKTWLLQLEEDGMLNQTVNIASLILYQSAQSVS